MEANCSPGRGIECDTSVATIAIGMRRARSFPQPATRPVAAAGHEKDRWFPTHDLRIRMHLTSSFPTTRPAVRLGFKPFDPRLAGVYGDEDWIRKRRAWSTPNSDYHRNDTEQRWRIATARLTLVAMSAADALLDTTKQRELG